MGLALFTRKPTNLEILSNQVIFNYNHDQACIPIFKILTFWIKKKWFQSNFWTNYCLLSKRWHLLWHSTTCMGLECKGRPASFWRQLHMQEPWHWHRSVHGRRRMFAQAMHWWQGASCKTAQYCKLILNFGTHCLVQDYLRRMTWLTAD